MFFGKLHSWNCVPPINQHFATLNKSNYFANSNEMIDLGNLASMAGKTIRLVIPNPLFNFNFIKREAASYNMPHVIIYNRVQHGFFSYLRIDPRRFCF